MSLAYWGLATMLDVLQEGLKVTILGSGVVFFALGALSFVLRLFGRFFGRQTPTDTTALQGSVRVQAGASSELAAVVAAVLAMHDCPEGSVWVTSVSRADK